MPATYGFSAAPRGTIWCPPKDGAARSLGERRRRDTEGFHFDARSTLQISPGGVPVTWVKLDDRYDDNRKIKRAWRKNKAAVGLHAMAITYCARHMTDGIVDLDWLEEKLQKPSELAATVAALVDAGLFEPIDGERFQIHDYLEHQASAESIAKSKAETSRKRSEAGKKGAEVRWHGDGKEDGPAMANGNGSAMSGSEANA